MNVQFTASLERLLTMMPRSAQRAKINATMTNNSLYALMHGACLDEMAKISDNGVDVVIADLPYGTTSCAWDSVISLEELWRQYIRVCRGAIILFGAQPFTSVLVASNIKIFRYELIWGKTAGTTPGTAKRRPMSAHESILIFGDILTYHPQMVSGKPYTRKSGRRESEGNSRKLGFKAGYITESDGRRYPLSVLKFKADRGLHPSQKPVALMEWLIRSYTNEFDTVLDNTMGSGTTGEACANTGRRFIGMEKYPLLDKPIDKKENPNYFFLAEERIRAAYERNKDKFE